MTILASELVCYMSVNRPVNDTVTGGGAIADLSGTLATTPFATGGKGVRAAYTQLAANDDVEAASNGVSDGTKTLTIQGRATTGAMVTPDATIAISATANLMVANAQVYERLSACMMSAVPIGIITVQRSPAAGAIGTIPAGEQGFAMFFQQSASAAGIVIRYDKCFWKNTNGTLTLNAAATMLTADPAARIRVGVHTAKGDTATIANRVTAPGGVTFVDDSVSQAVPTGILAAGEFIGLWIEENLPGSDPAHKSTFTTQLSGTTV